MTPIEIIHAAKRALEAMGYDKHDAKARYNNDLRVAIHKNNPLKNIKYFDYVNSLISKIQMARYELRSVEHPEANRFAKRAVGKKLTAVYSALLTYGFRLNWNYYDGKIELSLRAYNGRKRLTTVVEPNAVLVTCAHGLMINPVKVQESALGTIWHSSYADYKSLQIKQAYFAQDIAKRIYRCAGLPSSKKRLELAAIDFYARAM